MRVDDSTSACFRTKIRGFVSSETRGRLQSELTIRHRSGKSALISDVAFTLESMPVPIIHIWEFSSALSTCTFCSVQLWEMHSPMSQEVGFCGLAQVLMAIFAISPWTSWLVRKAPMQIETLRIPKIMIALITLTFLSRATERSMCAVIHCVLRSASFQHQK